MQLIWSGLTTPLLLAACVVFIAASVVYFSFFFLAQRPKRGTLEWIAEIDRPPFFFGCGECPLGKRDILPMALLALMAMAACSLTMLRASEWELLAIMEPTAKVEIAALMLVAPAAGTLAMYCLTRRLCGGCFAPIMASLLVVFDLDYDPSAMPFILLALAFFLRWWGVCQTGGFWRCFFEIFVLTAFVGVGAYFAPGVLWFAPVLFVPLTFAAVWRLVKCGGKCRVLRLLGTVFGFWILSAFWYTAANLPAVLLSSGQAFPQLLVQRETWTFIGTRLFDALSAILPQILPGIGLGVILLWVSALFSAAAGVYLTVRRHDLRGALLCWLTAASAALWLFGQLPAVLAAVPCAYIWERWRERGGKVPVAVGAGILLVCSIASYIILLKML